MLVVAELVVVAVVQLVEIVVAAGSVVAEDDLQTTVEHDASVADAVVVVVAFAVPLCDASVECAGSSAGTAEEC